jgi:hypothetical protein
MAQIPSSTMLSVLRTGLMGGLTAGLLAWAPFPAVGASATSIATSATMVARSPRIAPRELPPTLAKALSWVPENAVSFLVVPSMKRTSQDIEQLVEAIGGGGALAMGRPIDVLKAQLGVGANLDEEGPLVAYFPPATAVAVEPTQPLPTVLVPVTDAEAFLAANLKPDAAKGEDAFTSAQGITLYARKLDGRVALAPTRESLPAADMTRGVGERFLSRLSSGDATATKEAEFAWLARADLVAWGSRDALHAAVQTGRAMAKAQDAAESSGNADPIEVGGVPFTQFGGNSALGREKSFELMDMLADGVVAIDIDPLGVFIGALGVAEPSSQLAQVMQGGEKRGEARFNALPEKPFYAALSLDVDALGGIARVGELLDLVGVGRAVLPEWTYTDGADITSLQLAAYPSKLGVAVGGALNDSAMFVGSRAPERTLLRMRAGLEALAGESVGLRREATWTEGKKLKSGAIADAFELKETVVDASQRPGLDFERLAKQFIFGARGVHGLARRTNDGVVVTFSQRPDVFDRAVEAASGKSTLSADATVTSIEEWLPPTRDVEIMIGVGRVIGLAGQIASSFVSEEQLKGMLPAVPADAEPVAVALDLDKGRARTAIVLPAAILKLAVESGVSRATAPVAPREREEPTTEKVPSERTTSQNTTGQKSTSQESTSQKTTTQDITSNQS